jgi:hypothetical protein
MNRNLILIKYTVSKVKYTLRKLTRTFRNRDGTDTSENLKISCININEIINGYNNSE